MAGTAGALQGGLQMLLAGLSGSFVGCLSIQTAKPLAVIIIIFSIIALWLFSRLRKFSVN